MSRRGRLAFALACAGVVVSSSWHGGAACRATTKAPPADWDLIAQGCYDQAANPGAKDLYWKNTCVGYSLQRDASQQVSFDQASSIVASAFGAWSAITCNDGGRTSISAVHLGPVDCAAVQYNGAQPNQNIIVFRDDVWPYADANSTLGLTTVTFSVATGEILDADLEINSTQKLRVPPAVGAPNAARSSQTDGYDLAAIVLHEVGHFLGLGHSARADAVMYARYQATAHNLTDDDATGLCSAYGPDGVRATSAGPVAGDACDPTPRHGFSSACGSPGGDAPVTTPSSAEHGCAVQTAASRVQIANAWPAILVLAGSLARRRFRRTSRSSTTRPAAST